MQHRRAIQFSFPDLPAGFTPYEQALLGGLEAHLTRGHTRMRVKTELAMGNMRLVIAAIERLLTHAPVRRVLLVLGSPVYEALARREFGMARTREDKGWFCELFPVQFLPQFPLDNETARVCVTSLRKLVFRLKRLKAGEGVQQAQRSQELTDDDKLLAKVRAQFDVVVLYGMNSVTQRWSYLLEMLDPPFCINFSGALDPQVLSAFDLHLVCFRPAFLDTLHALVWAYAASHPEELERQAEALRAFFSAPPPALASLNLTSLALADFDLADTSGAQHDEARERKGDALDPRDLPAPLSWQPGMPGREAVAGIERFEAVQPDEVGRPLPNGEMRLAIETDADSSASEGRD